MRYAFICPHLGHQTEWKTKFASTSIFIDQMWVDRMGWTFTKNADSRRYYMGQFFLCHKMVEKKKNAHTRQICDICSHSDLTQQGTCLGSPAKAVHTQCEFLSCSHKLQKRNLHHSPSTQCADRGIPPVEISSTASTGGGGHRGSHPI